MTHILITGAAGTVGQALLDLCTMHPERPSLTATDVRKPARLPDGVSHLIMDVRDGTAVDDTIDSVRPEVVVHLASIVTPPPGATRDLQYDVDVVGSRNVLDACLKHGVRRLVVTSSGAAYGYHADNSVPLTESDPLRGNEAFAYARHKRLVEEMLAEIRQKSPELEQVILRVCTVLSPGLDNQITALFRKNRILGVSGSRGDFVFIWSDDLARIVLRAATDGPAGIFNVAGDGALGIADVAAALGKDTRILPAWLLKAALSVARPLGLSRYGPEQVRFLQFRPQLENDKLKRVFGYTPDKTSAEALAAWRESLPS